MPSDCAQPDDEYSVAKGTIPNAKDPVTSLLVDGDGPMTSCGPISRQQSRPAGSRNDTLHQDDAGDNFVSLDHNSTPAAAEVEAKDMEKTVSDNVGPDDQSREATNNASISRDGVKGEQLVGGAHTCSHRTKHTQHIHGADKKDNTAQGAFGNRSPTPRE